MAKKRRRNIVRKKRKVKRQKNSSFILKNEGAVMLSSVESLKDTGTITLSTAESLKDTEVISRSSSKGNWISLAMIAIGIILVTIPIIINASLYPWATIRNENVNEIVLPDPPPPSFTYTVYSPTDEDERAEDDEFDITEQYTVLPGIEIPQSVQEILAGNIPSAAPTATPVPTRRPDPTPIPYVLLGNVKIPRINISENLFIGVDQQTRYGVGFLEGSAMPGQPGNCVIAAHRTASSGKQPFRHLDKMLDGDIIQINVNDESFEYVVFDMFIVSKEDVWVLKPNLNEKYMLTVITCDPVIYSGHRPDRLIVRARLVDNGEEVEGL